MHSFGREQRAAQHTLLASSECGGNRSSFIGSDAETFLRRRAFFKSAAAPAASETESIMPKETPPENLLQAKVVFFIPKVIASAFLWLTVRRTSDAIPRRAWLNIPTANAHPSQQRRIFRHHETPVRKIILSCSCWALSVQSFSQASRLSRKARPRTAGRN